MKSKSGKLVIILIGSPGSGKGTQGELLAKKLGLFYFETSKVIEERVMQAKKGEYVRVRGKKYFLVRERNLWRKGILNTPVVVSVWIQEKFRGLAEKRKNLVIAGSPRTMPEARDVMPLLEKLYGKKNIKILNIALSDKEAIWRNSHRRICQKCRHPIPYFEETKNLKKCLRCGAKLIRRKKLDDPGIIKVRLRQYKIRTKPLFNYFKKRGLKVIEINGEQSIEEVFNDIIKKIQMTKPK